MSHDEWVEVGGEAELLTGPAVREVRVGRTKVALVRRDGVFSAISGVCNHVGGPLGEGRLDGDYVVCPWHGWKFHRATGEGEPGFEADKVPAHAVRVSGGRVQVSAEPVSGRAKKPHEPHPLARRPVREPGPVRVVGISTTVMNRDLPRFSTSDELLGAALGHCGGELECEHRLIRLNDLSFRACEGYYSKSARACTWPCSITQMDPEDQLDRVYEAIVHWADVILVATPIRWGAASALYYKMVERMNCVQNQITLANRVLLKNKVAAFVITGGQDNVQAVAGQMLGFFAEVGCVFPQYPYIAHSRGWDAEDMERNVAAVRASSDLHDAARELAARAVDMARLLLASTIEDRRLQRGGRKAYGPHRMSED
ncbi:MAG: putative Dioxygenase, ferredoxin subunit, and Flavodoxin (Modular protein) [Acidobacteria bacterium]|jgi:nitrite reductase/ring-hydroxylating ferredoxin subunit/multimeric flavodoxin WrbA|nr:putative Dioxygenase, ferredoxin subunit, and Flavodoxin (Modular protein) [Acidobacteriota bacterium]